MNVSAYKLPPTFREADSSSGCRRWRVHSSHSSFSRRSYFAWLNIAPQGGALSKPLSAFVIRRCGQRRSLTNKVLALVGSGFNYLRAPIAPLAVSSSNLNSILVTGGAGFIGSNLVLALQERMPDARLTVIDDFRSGDFKNLAGYKGDLVAQNLATLDWQEQFGDPAEAGFDVIFHLASITDTTLHDQFVQTHDNVESFRRLLNFARPHKTRVIYASSAATYGAASAASVETNGAAPANVYAFSKAIMDNLANRAAAE